MNFHRRKNNEHWTHEEVEKLVKGVKTYGVGRWTMVKSHYFSSSVRDPTHLKVCLDVMGMLKLSLLLGWIEVNTKVD